MGFLTPCFVPRGVVLYTMIVPVGGFLLPSSHVPGELVLDETDTCIIPIFGIMEKLHSLVLEI